MNLITKQIIKAVFLEGIGAILLGTAFYGLFFSFAEIIDFFEALWFPILIGFLAMYFAGRIIGNSFSSNFKFKIRHGVAIVFVLLIIAIVMGVMAMLLLSDWDSVGIQGVFSVILVFLVFGGLPTLVVGIWLGYDLKKLHKN